MDMFKSLVFFISVLTACVPAYAEEGMDYARERRIMIDSQVAARGIHDSKILGVVGRIERHRFVPESMREYAYEDISLPVGGDEAVPPAYFVSLVAQLSGLKGEEKVLELGIESGYQAAVLAELSKEVYCVEPSEELALQSEQRLKALGYRNIKVKAGNIEGGWPEFAPYDVIVITNPMNFAPKQAVDQLMMNGRLVMPMREYWGKKLIVLTKAKKGSGYEMTATLVTPVVGEAPSEKAQEESPPEKKEAAKWEAVNGSKWMKRR